jgi:hypothetical protein
MVKVDVGNEGNGDRLPNPGKGRRRLKIKDGHPDQLAPRLFQGVNLGHGGIDISGVSIGHRLHRDGTSVTHGHMANLDSPGLAPYNHVHIPYWF